MKNPIVGLCTGAAASMLLASSMNVVRADQQVGAQFNQLIHINANISESGCNNSPGPQITLSGEITLGGLGVQLLFENNLKGTHQTVVTFATNVVLIPAGQKIVIPKQPVLGGVGGNPLIWLQFIDDSGKSLSDPIFLGRCVQGLTIPQDLLNSSIAGLLVAAAGCDNNPGPYITFGGGVGLSGLKARFIFQNNLDGTHTATAVSDVSLIPSGALVKIPKQPVLGGSGGNPLVFIQLLQGNGTPIGDLEFLGRCNQL